MLYFTMTPFLPSDELETWQTILAEKSPMPAWVRSSANTTFTVLVMKRVWDGIGRYNGRPKPPLLKRKNVQCWEVNYEDVVRRGVFPNVAAFVTAFLHSGSATGDKLPPRHPLIVAGKCKPNYPNSFPFPFVNIVEPCINVC